MSKRLWIACAVLALSPCACGGEDGGTEPADSPMTLESLALNHGTVECDVITADDLTVESCNHVVVTYLLVMRKRPYAVTLGLKTLEPGTYEVDGGGRGFAITLSDATDMEDIKNYGIGKLKVVLEESDGVYSGTYEGEVMKDYTVPIPIKGMFKFDRSKVSE